MHPRPEPSNHTLKRAGPRWRFQFRLSSMFLVITFAALAISIPLSLAELLILGSWAAGWWLGRVLRRATGKGAIWLPPVCATYFTFQAVTISYAFFFSVAVSFSSFYPILAISLLGAIAALVAAPVYRIAAKAALSFGRATQSSQRHDVTKTATYCFAAAVLVCITGFALVAGFRGWHPHARIKVTDSPHWSADFALSPDGRSLAVAGDDGFIRIWELGSRARMVRTITASFAPRLNLRKGLSFSPDGQLFAYNSRETAADILLLHTDTWRRKAKLASETVNSVCWHLYVGEFSADGSTFATLARRYTQAADSTGPAIPRSPNDAIWIWDTDTWTVRQRCDFPDVSRTLALSQDHQLFARWREEPAEVIRRVNLELWRLDTHAKVSDGPERGFWPTQPLCFSPDKQWLCAGSALWNLKTGDLGTLPGLGWHFTPDGRWLIVTVDGIGSEWAARRYWVREAPFLRMFFRCKEYSRLLVYDLETSKPLIASRRVPRVRHVELSAGGTTIATAMADGTIRIWDMPRRQAT